MASTSKCSLPVEQQTCNTFSHYLHVLSMCLYLYKLSDYRPCADQVYSSDRRLATHRPSLHLGPRKRLACAPSSASTAVSRSEPGEPATAPCAVGDFRLGEQSEACFSLNNGFLCSGRNGKERTNCHFAAFQRTKRDHCGRRGGGELSVEVGVQGVRGSREELVGARPMLGGVSGARGGGGVQVR
ncbi:hypothetical protein EYF80_011346 [Liparis tanakae]|uniref:Uncharacterized protein n=1 Tax=Liparis tanakae TaxID=230148 RepID=A0A4Z2IME2_9TELE|nr:hypothetical protein EYF80_011346 [Liparis tanakae]